MLRRVLDRLVELLDSAAPVLILFVVLPIVGAIFLGWFEPWSRRQSVSTFVPFVVIAIVLALIAFCGILRRPPAPTIDGITFAYLLALAGTIMAFSLAGLGNSRGCIDLPSWVRAIFVTCYVPDY